MASDPSATRTSSAAARAAVAELASSRTAADVLRAGMDRHKDLAALFESETVANAKAEASDNPARFSEIVSDPSNLLVPRCRHAGKVVNTTNGTFVVMSNGIVVTKDGYYGDKFSKILQLNGGVHEAAEERLFAAILTRMAPSASIVELGAYWPVAVPRNT